MPAQESVMMTPELLLHILDQMNVDQLRIAALVCKDWSMLAMKTLSETACVSLSRLLNLLEVPGGDSDEGRKSPMKYCQDPRWQVPPHFLVHPVLRDVGDGDWRRFLEQHTSKVRHLKLTRALHPSTLDTANTLLDGVMNGREEAYTGSELDWHLLKWKQTLELISHPSVTAITIKQFESSSKAIETLLAILASKYTGIRTINLASPNYSFNYSRFPNLRIVQLGGQIDQRSWASLSECPSLHTIRLYPDPFVTGNCRIFDPDLRFYFPTLQHLKLSDDLPVPLLLIILRNSTMPLLRQLEANLKHLEVEEARNLPKQLLGNSPLLDIKVVLRMTGSRELR
ncbi:hypothetical protein FRB96_004444 [Tulasnella sp. 330]|nr:hypothetical protein FRB96_004444 [Tulasnella sp. 330]